jgi:hypothetical protein
MVRSVWSSRYVKKRRPPAHTKNLQEKMEGGEVGGGGGGAYI